MNHSFVKERLLPILAGVAVIVSALSGRFFVRGQESVLATGSWGLSFRQEGQAPVGNASVDALKKYDAVFYQPSGGKTLYLTFDAGYENGYTPQILDVLKSQQVPAAFFLVGTYIQNNPQLVLRMVQEGHIVGNHTQRHPDMSKITQESAFLQELGQVEEAYKSLTGEDLPKFYRPPQGIYSEENLRLAQKAGYKTVFWSLAYVDWLDKEQASPESALRKLLPRIHDGAVILLHSTSQTNAKILDEFITRCKALGYEFAPISQIFPLT